MVLPIEPRMESMSTKKKPSQAALIRTLLAKKVPVEKIVAQVRKACGGEPTTGYVNWISNRTRSSK
jgi:hypothetical protein